MAIKTAKIGKYQEQSWTHGQQWLTVVNKNKCRILYSILCDYATHIDEGETLFFLSFFNSKKTKHRMADNQIVLKFVIYGLCWFAFRTCSFFLTIDSISLLLWKNFKCRTINWKCTVAAFVRTSYLLSLFLLLLPASRTGRLQIISDNNDPSYYFFFSIKKMTKFWLSL